MEPLDGYDPTFLTYQVSVLPLNYRGKMECPRDASLLNVALNGYVLHKMAGPQGLEP